MGVNICTQNSKALIVTTSNNDGSSKVCTACRIGGERRGHLRPAGNLELPRGQRHLRLLEQQQLEHPNQAIFYPHPDLCNQMVRCSDGCAFEQSCPAGQLWNDCFNFCDFATNVACGSRSCLNLPCKQAPPCELIDGFQCPQPNGVFSDPNNCKAYIHCANGIAARERCGTHFSGVQLWWNDRFSYCDFFENVECGGRPTNVP